MKPPRSLIFSLLLIPHLPCTGQTTDQPTAQEKASPKIIPLDLKKATVTILPKPPTHLPAPEQLAVTQKIHALITKTAKKEALEAYQVPVPKADNSPLKFVPIPTGTFKMGPPDGKQHTVAISPFWMSETEITWLHYNPFYLNDAEFKTPRNKDGTLDTDNDRYSSNQPDLEKVALVDAVSQPTYQYHDMFDRGRFAKDTNYPAMDMTNHAASKFCQWLSAQTGHFYRLPTEAEWEYACRAGTESSYSFGDDASQIDHYSWSRNNSKTKNQLTYNHVAQKKPNPWGLYDMHGNVNEWTIDGFASLEADFFPSSISNPWIFPTKRYPRVFRGGSFEDFPEDQTSSSRATSSNTLKKDDPQIPRSVWYHTHGQKIGFRVVRPQTIPSVEEMHLFWNTDFRAPERTQEDL